MHKNQPYLANFFLMQLTTISYDFDELVINKVGAIIVGERKGGPDDGSPRNDKMAWTWKESLAVTLAMCSLKIE